MEILKNADIGDQHGLLGGHVFTNQTVLIANVRVFQYFHLDQQPAAIMGSGLLKDNSLAIDFARQRLYIGPAVTQ